MCLHLQNIILIKIKRVTNQQFCGILVLQYTICHQKHFVEMVVAVAAQLWQLESDCFAVCMTSDDRTSHMPDPVRGILR